MPTIKLTQRTLEALYTKTRSLSSEASEVAAEAQSAANEISTLDFSACASITANVRRLQKRLNKQADLARQFSTLARAVSDEMAAADGSFGTESNSLWDRVRSWVSDKTQKLSLALKNAFSSHAATAGLFLLSPASSTTITSVGRLFDRVKEWFKDKFGKKKDKGKSGTGKKSGGDGAKKGNATTEKTEKLLENQYSVKELEEMRANGTRIDTSKLDRKISYKNVEGKGTGYYVPENGCTWYAAARYRQVNGTEKELKFATCGGNANSWVNTIDKNAFDVNATGDTSLIKANTIAVSTEADAWNSFSKEARDLGYGNVHASEIHVAYVEAVKDGYVYLSQGAWSQPESTYGYIVKVPIEDFKKDYEYVISAK